MGYPPSDAEWDFTLALATMAQQERDELREQVIRLRAEVAEATEEAALYYKHWKVVEAERDALRGRLDKLEDGAGR